MFQVPESVSNHHQRGAKVNFQNYFFKFLLSQKVYLVILGKFLFGCRSQIAIPAQGLIEFRDALTGLAHF